jgi:DNA uptake protein ComE-like DNA-binding protein
MKNSINFPVFKAWKIGLLMALLSVSTSLFSQENDSLSVQLIRKITDQFERLSENSDETLDFTDLLDEYLFYTENPVNINSKDSEQLRDAKIMSNFQYERLQDYIEKFGALQSIYELSAIEGFDNQTIDLLKPVITMEANQEKIRFNPVKIAKWGKNQVIIRTEEVLQKSIGYQEVPDSALFAKPSSAYLGSRQKLYTKYAFSYRNHIRLGITAEKDAGEVFLKKSVPDSLQKILGNKLKNGFDFYSAHLFLSDYGLLKSLAIGDYHLAFGQGLTMWSGLSFGKSGSSTNIMKYGQGVKPSSSANENTYLRGAAVTLQHKILEMSLFYSNKLFDGNIGSTDSLESEDIYVTSIQESGLHRTVNELLDKGVIRQEMYGGNLSLQFRRLKIAYTIHRNEFETSILQSTQPYNQYSNIPNSNTNQGIDMKVFFPELVLFGEISRSQNGGTAGIAGFTLQPSSFASITMSYRNYSRDFQNFYANGFGENSETNNEQGLYLGLSADLTSNLSLTAYSDFFSFPWLKYQTDAPSQGHDYYAQLDYRINRKASSYFRFRTKTKMTNDDNPWNYIDPLTDYTKTSIRFHIDYAVSQTITFKDRVEFVFYETQKSSDQGFILFHDIQYQPLLKPIQITFRYAIFDSESYDSRLYAYENDVLYAFSIPSFNGQGSRSYLLFKYQPVPSLNIWFKIAQTWYADQKRIGTGLDEISGNKKTEVRIQLQWKF